MQALAQNVAIGATMLFLAGMVLRQVPVLGFLVRLVTRVLLMVSPIMVIVLIAGLVWFHGGSLFAEKPGIAPVPPINAPIPTERPGG